MRIHAVFVTFVMLAAAASAQSPATRLAPGLGWLDKLAEAKALARKTGKPLLLVFRCDP